MQRVIAVLVLALLCVSVSSQDSSVDSLSAPVQTNPAVDVRPVSPVEEEVPPTDDTASVPTESNQDDVVPPTETVGTRVPPVRNGAYQPRAPRTPGTYQPSTPRAPGTYQPRTRAPGTYQRRPFPPVRTGAYQPRAPRPAGYQRTRPANYHGTRQTGGSSTLCNPITGIRARNGGPYATLLSRMGVQAGNCGGAAAGEAGPVNPITGIRARPGGIYATVLNAAGVGNARNGAVNPLTGIRARPGGIYATVLNAAGVGGNAAEGQGLLGNNGLVQAINAQGGLLAVGDSNSALDSSASSQSGAMPAWAIAGIVLMTLVAVGTIGVLAQLVVLVRST